LTEDWLLRQVWVVPGDYLRDLLISPGAAPVTALRDHGDMARIYANTTPRGYGRPHQLLRAALLAAWQSGDKCTICGQPIWSLTAVSRRTGQQVPAVHLAHDHQNGGYLGLAHRRCNIGESSDRRLKAKGWLLPRRW
jgi:hypothetical protein